MGATVPCTLELGGKSETDLDFLGRFILRQDTGIAYSDPKLDKTSPHEDWTGASKHIPYLIQIDSRILMRTRVGVLTYMPKPGECGVHSGCKVLRLWREWIEAGGGRVLRTLSAGCQGLLHPRRCLFLTCMTIAETTVDGTKRSLMQVQEPSIDDSRSEDSA